MISWCAMRRCWRGQVMQGKGVGHELVGGCGANWYWVVWRGCIGDVFIGRGEKMILVAKDLASGRAWRAVLRALDFSADTAPRDAATTLDMIAARVMGRLVYGRTADPEQLAAEVERFFNVCVQTAVEY